MVFAVSVTLKRTVSASFSRTTLPPSTSPPMRNGRSRGASLAATWVGVRKNTRLDWNAFSTSAAASPRAPTPDTIHTARLVLGFKVALLVDAAQRACARELQADQLRHDGDGGGRVGHGQVESVVRHVN